MIDSFSFAATPHIHFGVGKRSLLPSLIEGFGRKLLLVTGHSSFEKSELCQQLWQQLQIHFDVQHVQVRGEPSPFWVDKVVSEFYEFSPDCVLAIGGGSAVDAAKAIAALLSSGDSVMLYLEGVGQGKVFNPPTTPFIAMPTTAGTGGETSKNAVLSSIGEAGFKKSFRHESLVPKHIILDPELTISCPSAVTAACGMDAFTQLLESYVSLSANPMTDALACSGLQYIKDCLLPAVSCAEDVNARCGMLYASAISGLTLANAGLGSVHGLASPLGAFFSIPHGVVCGALLYEATRINIVALKAAYENPLALKKYAHVGRIFHPDLMLNDEEAHIELLSMLKKWSEELEMPKLSIYDVQPSDIEKLIKHISGGSMATNPVKLTHSQLHELLEAVL